MADNKPRYWDSLLQVWVELNSFNADKLGNQDPSYYLNYDNFTGAPDLSSLYLGINATAKDSEKVRNVNFYTGTVAPTVTTRLNMDGYLYATRVYNAVYNDYAEYFKKAEKMEPGDVVVLEERLDNEVYIRSHSDCSKFVVGVVSDEYAHCIGGNGDGHDDENFVAIGMAGRVNVKVCGIVKKGDLLVSSNLKGTARAIKEDEFVVHGTVIGKALENKTASGTGKVRMLIQLM